MKKPALKFLLLLAIIGICVGYLRLTTRQTDRDQGYDADGTRYATMAGDTTFPKAYARIAPFCYRVATPWIASKAPGATIIDKFKFVAFVDAVLMMLLCFILLRSLGFAEWSSLVGMLLYAGVFWTVQFSFFSSVYIDHMTQVLTLLVLLCMSKGWWYLLPPIIFGACFQKESIVALIPFVMVYYLHQKGWKWVPLYIVGLLMVAASVIAFLILRNNVHPVNVSDASFALSKSWEVATTSPGYSRILIVAIFSGLGILPLLLLSRFEFVLGYLRRNPAWIVMILIGIFLLFGGIDKSRLFLYMLPGIVVLAVAAIEDFRRQMTPWNFRLWVAILLLLHTILASWYTPFDDFYHYLDLLVPEWSVNLGAAGFSKATIITLLFLLMNFVLFRLSRKQLLSENKE